ncbi:cystathionine beta-lyase [Variovorax ginsengisoli]|uniref:Cystathionine beta-lyase n=1 Tax=Variovorax ginsengisoli TaxID=363844 RepID=A0ABT8SCN5_9BURK|nr:cystathionine beta-lyase [Variovorax ginsengisoli]MDN8617501.1 cystathionine beta-lyase [Variovorax ginsengisoli]MDO1536671.1 cystathionine beta-lyase [Variovorax ginsengisoli]
MPLHLDTRLAHCGRPAMNGDSGPVNVPVVRTSTVRFDSIEAMHAQVRKRAGGLPISTYGRQGTQTHRALEEAMCELEGGSRAFLTPSGLAAISLTLLALTAPGDHVLAIDSVYQPVRKLDAGHLARNGVRVDYFDPLTERIEDRLRPETRVVYVETPGSLLFEMYDLVPIVAACRERGISVVADNTWASGYLFNPLALGADISLIAGTKYVSGHSDLMLGVIVTRDAAHASRLATTYEALGLAVSPDDVYLALRGLRTMAVRMQQHAHNALAVARWLAQHPGVDRVYYPALESDPGHALWRRDFRGANGLLSVGFRGLAETQLFAIADALALFDIGASWGGYESLVLPATADKLAAHRGWHGTAGVLRLHIGLENTADLIADLAQAIAGAQAAR